MNNATVIAVALIFPTAPSYAIAATTAHSFPNTELILYSEHGNGELRIAFYPNGTCRFHTTFLDVLGKIIHLVPVDGYDEHYVVINSSGILSHFAAATGLDAIINVMPNDADYLFAEAIAANGTRLSAKFATTSQLRWCTGPANVESYDANFASVAIRLSPTILEAGVNAKLNIEVTESEDPSQSVRAIYGQPAYMIIYDPLLQDIILPRVLPNGPSEQEVAAHAGHDIDEIPNVDGVHLRTGNPVGPFSFLHVTLPHSGSFLAWVEIRVGNRTISERLSLSAR